MDSFPENAAYFCAKKTFSFRQRLLIMYSETTAIASATFSLIETITVLRTRFGVVLQWRNRLARRTYKQYLPSKRCGGCEFEPHLEHAFSYWNTYTLLPARPVKCIIYAAGFEPSAFLSSHYQLQDSNPGPLAQFYESTSLHNYR